MGKVNSVTFASSLTNICEVNSSFDRGVLRICYTGENRNGSYISKQAICNSLDTIRNCPIVCNYDRDTDSLGGHDMEVVRNDNGDLRLINLTQPVGVIPESANLWFDNYEDEDGVTHEYLYADVLLWKRQEAYQKIKNDGVVSHSMEISIKDGKMIDGIYHINDFEFTAFALIGVTPCYESSALEVFSAENFKNQMVEMMHDLKEMFRSVVTNNDGNECDKKSTEGGKEVLNEKIELAAEYGIDINTLEFSIEDLTVEELREKFEEIRKLSEEEIDKNKNDFALNGEVVEEMRRVLSAEKVTREWGECDRYHFVDCDTEASEVYCYDSQDWLLYGFGYSMNGDNVVIDFESKKRMKCAIVPFDEGEQVAPFADVFSVMENRIVELADVEAKFNEATNKITEMESELEVLRKFRLDTESDKKDAQREALYSEFNDLSGLEEFAALKEEAKSEDYTIDMIREKCYALRGRLVTPKFSLESTKTPKIKVEKESMPNEPYGGLFVKYGVASNIE